jgi:hypothetical protein
LIFRERDPYAFSMSRWISIDYETGFARMETTTQINSPAYKGAVKKLNVPATIQETTTSSEVAQYGRMEERSRLHSQAPVEGESQVNIPATVHDNTTSSTKYARMEAVSQSNAPATLQDNNISSKVVEDARMEITSQPGGQATVQAAVEYKGPFSFLDGIQEKFLETPPDAGRFVEEMIPESLELIRSNVSGVAIPDEDDYTYYEDDDDDNASIHHDTEDDDAAISNAKYDNNARPLARPPASLTRVSAHVNETAGDGVLPAHLNDQLEKWYARHGRHVPKCVTRRRPVEMSEIWYRRKTKDPITWLHTSGAKLDVKWYHLPGFLNNSDHGPKLIVVSGSGVPPTIVSYNNAGGYIKGVRESGITYRIWCGVYGDKDGFEKSPSVIKMARANASHNFDPNKKAPAQKAGSTVLPTRVAVEVPTSSKMSSRARKPSTKYGAAPLSKKIKLSSSTPNNDETEEDLSDSTSLLNKFMASPPVVTGKPEVQWPSGVQASQLPLRYICYLCGKSRTEKNMLYYHLRKDHGVTSAEEDRIQQRRVLSPRALKAITHEENSNKPKAKLPEPVKLKLTQEPVSTVPRRTPEDIDKYIKSNTQVMFFSAQGGSSRCRMLTACDSVHKLFAQAIAGSVFTREKSRVLSVEIVDEEGELPVVEDDEDDFNDFIKQLRRASCWSVVGGKCRGDTIVYVREKWM